jgi:hypothetical protein
MYKFARILWEVRPDAKQVQEAIRRLVQGSKYVHKLIKQRKWRKK